MRRRPLYFILTGIGLAIGAALLLRFLPRDSGDDLPPIVQLEVLGFLRSSRLLTECREDLLPYVPADVRMDDGLWSGTPWPPCLECWQRWSDEALPPKASYRYDAVFRIHQKTVHRLDALTHAYRLEFSRFSTGGAPS